jgi:hypothetical protein
MTFSSTQKPFAFIFTGWITIVPLLLECIYRKLTVTGFAVKQNTVLLYIMLHGRIYLRLGTVSMQVADVSCRAAPCTDSDSVSGLIMYGLLAIYECD